MSVMNDILLSPIRLSDLESLIEKSVQRALEHNRPSSNVTENDKPLSVEEAAQFLGCEKQTLYQNIKKIPHRKRFGRLYFFKGELLDYLDSGSQATNSTSKQHE